MKFDPKKQNALSVQLHGRQIGIITRLAGDRQLFAFEQDYIDDQQRPTLSLSFKGSTGGLVTNFRPVGRRVPAFFSNLLPEGHLREYLAERADVNPEREFFLLAVFLVFRKALIEGVEPGQARQQAEDAGPEPVHVKA